MPRRQNLHEFLAQGELKSGQDEEGIINDEQVQRPIQPGTQRNYKRVGDLWKS